MLFSAAKLFNTYLHGSLESGSLKLRLAGHLWEEHSAGGFADFLFRVFFYGTVFLLASSYRTIPIACHFACLSLLWGFVGL